MRKGWHGRATSRPPPAIGREHHATDIQLGVDGSVLDFLVSEPRLQCAAYRDRPWPGRIHRPRGAQRMANSTTRSRVMRHDAPPRTTCVNCLAKRVSIREDAGHVLYAEHKTMAALMGTRAHVSIGAAILTASLVSAPEKVAPVE